MNKTPVDIDQEAILLFHDLAEQRDNYARTDEKAGFNAYFLTDTPTLGKDTQKTYMAIRGSYGFNLDKLSVQGIKALNLNDWVVNDAQFAINNIHIC